MRGNRQDDGQPAPDERGAPLPPLEFRRDKPLDPCVAFSLIGRPGARLIPTEGRGRRSLAVAGSRGKAGPLYGEGFYWLSHVSSNQRAGVGRTSYAKFSKKSRDSAPSPRSRQPRRMRCPIGAIIPLAASTMGSVSTLPIQR